MEKCLLLIPMEWGRELGWKESNSYPSPCSFALSLFWKNRCIELFSSTLQVSLRDSKYLFILGINLIANWGALEQLETIIQRDESLRSSQIPSKVAGGIICWWSPDSRFTLKWWGRQTNIHSPQILKTILLLSGLVCFTLLILNSTHVFHDTQRLIVCTAEPANVFLKQLLESKLAWEHCGHIVNRFRLGCLIDVS